MPYLWLRLFFHGHSKQTKKNFSRSLKWKEGSSLPPSCHYLHLHTGLLHERCSCQSTQLLPSWCSFPSTQIILERSHFSNNLQNRQQCTTMHTHQTWNKSNTQASLSCHIHEGIHTGLLSYIALSANAYIQLSFHPWCV